MDTRAGLVLVGVLVLVSGHVDQESGPVVTTMYGKVRGKVQYLPGGSRVDVFLGIPYASAPTGSQRFRRPIAPSSWSFVRNATNYGAPCPQTGSITNTNEDCLYLNVFTPQVSGSDVSPSLPVMVFIHGGAYTQGSGQLYNSTMIAKKGVVVVNFNYRLGALGYLSTEDADCPGNNGMLDQVFVLQWVKDNIAAFGGNTSHVTIFGESAGSSSVSLHLISPLSKGLFHGAILESGESLSPWAAGKMKDHPSPRERAFELGTKLGCHTNTSKDLLTCLRKVDANRFPSTTVAAPVDYTEWYPVVETINNFLPDAPASLIKAGKVADVPAIRGTNTEEYSAFLANTPGIQDGITLEKLLGTIHEFVSSHYGSNPNRTKIEDAIKSVYAAPANITNNSTIRTSYIRMFSDFDFTAPSTLETQLSAERVRQSPLYTYLFGYRSEKESIPLWMGVPHAAELKYVFGVPVIPIFANFTEADKIFSDTVITLWTNFAKFWNPTPVPVSGVTWPAFTKIRQSFLFLGERITADQNIRPAEMRLWNEVIPNLSGKT